MKKGFDEYVVEKGFDWNSVKTDCNVEGLVFILKEEPGTPFPENLLISYTGQLVLKDLRENTVSIDKLRRLTYLRRFPFVYVHAEKRIAFYHRLGICYSSKRFERDREVTYSYCQFSGRFETFECKKLSFIYCYSEVIIVACAQTLQELYLFGVSVKKNCFKLPNLRKTNTIDILSDELCDSVNFPKLESFPVAFPNRGYRIYPDNYYDDRLWPATRNWRFYKTRDYILPKLFCVRLTVIFCLKRFLGKDVTRMICNMITPEFVYNEADFTKFIDEESSKEPYGISKTTFERLGHLTPLVTHAPDNLITQIRQCKQKAERSKRPDTVAKWNKRVQDLEEIQAAVEEYEKFLPRKRIRQ